MQKTFMPSHKTAQDIKLAFIGFGEAAMAFAQGWAQNNPPMMRAYDIKTSQSDPVRQQKLADYDRHGVTGCMDTASAIAGADVIFSLVTADQALQAARQVAKNIASPTLFFDGNSCAPQTKQQSAEEIEKAGGTYIDVAIMAPVHPGLHKTSLLVSGPQAEKALAMMAQLDMVAKHMPGKVGFASSIKMVRSIMMKGLEALAAECVLAGKRAGVDEIVLDSLEATYPGFGWKDRAGYMLERMIVHGERRAAEMREVALTIEQLGLKPEMTAATVRRQQQIADLKLSANCTDYNALAEKILNGIEAKQKTDGD